MNVVRASGIGSGWNLGNTLDANSTGDKSNKGLSTESSWGMPNTTEDMIRAVATKGFKTIRIPVSWHNHIVSSNYTIDEAWLSRVKRIVDWSKGYGMSVIINIHHDNLTESQMASTYGFCIPEGSNENLKNQSIAYIRAVWTQIAAYFRDYGDELIFEVLNEPRCIGKSYEWNTPSGTESLVRAANQIICEYERVALEAIRADGGNNASRYVMIPPYAASPSMMDGWSLPADAANKLIVSVHAYTPYNFCMNQLSEKNFTEAHKRDIDWLFNNLTANYTSRGIKVVMGEASASDKNNNDERKKWINYYYGKAKAAGIPVILWDNMVVYPNGSNAGERHGWFNRNTVSWFFPDLIDEMLKY